MITKKTKVFAISSALLLAAALGMLFVGVRYIQTQGAELLHQTKEVANYNAREQSYRELSQLIDVTGVERDELLTYVLTEDKTIDFLADVERIAVEQGVELTTNTLQVTQTETIFDTLAISYAVTGSKIQVYTLLQILEKLPYHSKVSEVSFQSLINSKSDVLQGTIELTLSLLQHDR